MEEEEAEEAENDGEGVKIEGLTSEYGVVKFASGLDYKVSEDSEQAFEEKINEV